MSSPTFALEQEFLDSGVSLLAAVDEVGRGALAGPVSVGVVLVDGSVGVPPRGLRDSKLLSPAGRVALVGPIRSWVLCSAVGHASAGEVDTFGLTGALRWAACRALAQLPDADLVLLDGSHDYLSDPQQPTLFGRVPGAAVLPDGRSLPPVVTRVKADLTCVSVAAASVLAKVERDAVMGDLDRQCPDYRFASNRGYGSAEHLAAVSALGPGPHHRRSWRLPDRQLSPG